MIKYFFQRSFVWQEGGVCFLVRLVNGEPRIESIETTLTGNGRWWNMVGAIATGWGGVATEAGQYNTCKPFEIGEFAQSRGGALISAPKPQNGWITVGYKDGHRIIESIWGIPGRFLAIGAPIQGSYHKWYQATPYTEDYTPTSANDGSHWHDIAGNKGDTLAGTDAGSGGYDERGNAKWLGLLDSDFSEVVKPGQLLAFALIAGLAFGGIALYKHSQ